MRKVYYNPVQKLTVLLAILAGWFATLATAAQQTSFKASALESHEGLTITVRPWTDPALYKEKFHKKSPYAAGIVALQVNFHNETEDSLKVHLERIRLNITLSDEDQRALIPLTSEEAADVILHPGAKDPTKQRLPFPIGGPKVGRDKKWTEVEEELREAGVKASVIAPHGTIQGLLYFDLQSQFDLLNTARLYVPEIIALEKNRELLYFEVDLSRAAEH